MNRTNLKYTAVIVSVLLLGAFYCTFPLVIRQGLPFVDDMAFHAFQADEFTKAVDEGVLFPRWVADFNNGYGSPNFVFYSPLGYYFVSFFRMFGFSLSASMITVVWFGFFLSGVTMFLAASKFTDEKAALFAAVAYQIMPFHLADLYLRGTFAELSAFLWFPLIVLFLHNATESGDSKSWAGLSLSYAGLILTHLVSAFIFSFVMGAYLIFRAARADWKAALRTLFPVGMGLGISAYYLIPAAVEQKFVHIGYVTMSSFGDYRKNFLFTADKFQGKLPAFYFPIHAAVLLELILFLFVVLRMRRDGLNNATEKFFMATFVTSLFLMTSLSRPVWHVMPGFPFLQFPWRWMPVLELSLCFLIGGIMSANRGYAFRKKAALYVLIVLVPFSFAMIHRVETYSDFSQLLGDPEKGTRVWAMEYRPIWSDDMKVLMSGAAEKVSVISGSARTRVLEWKAEKRTVQADADVPSRLRVSTFYYPGWEASIDGKRSRVMREEGTGAMLLDIPAGASRVELCFADTPLRRYAKYISLASLVIMIMSVAAGARKGDRHRGMPGR